VQLFDVMANFLSIFLPLKKHSDSLVFILARR